MSYNKIGSYIDDEVPKYDVGSELKKEIAELKKKSPKKTK